MSEELKLNNEGSKYTSTHLLGNFSTSLALTYIKLITLHSFKTVLKMIKNRFILAKKVAVLIFGQENSNSFILHSTYLTSISICVKIFMHLCAASKTTQKCGFFHKGGTSFAYKGFTLAWLRGVLIRR